jgi:predicted enzyme related to lactoylglutathione lyase
MIDSKMIDTKSASGTFCWVDLAATDADAAKAFYSRMFGWTACEQRANGGVFTRLRLAGRDLGSLYQLSRAQRDSMPSHWTAYVRVDDLDYAAERATACGGQILVRPFAVADVARIALIRDSVGAPVGLWEPAHARDPA